MKRILAVIIMVFISGCTLSPRSCPDPGEARMVKCPRQWNEKDGAYHLRHAGSIAFPGRKIPVEGFMLLHPEAKRARVKVWSTFGMELFSLTVFENRTESGYIQPGLNRIPNFASLVGKSVRRSFFSPDEGKKCFLKEDRILACVQTQDGPVEYIYDARGLLREKKPAGDNPEWRVAFKEYTPLAGDKIPASIIYKGKDFRVSLKLKEAEESCPAK
ncbi:MAG: hypothetical protein ACQES5_07835 [Thermodesulfobacteriota bacterium]